MKALFIMGSMECGTASLFEWLAHHPKISPSTVNRSAYFSEQFSGQFSEQEEHEQASQRGGLTEQSESLTDIFQGRIQMYQVLVGRLRDSPQNLGIVQGVQPIDSRIARSAASSKLIYIVRNPFERIESQFHYLNHLGAAGHGADLCSEDYVSSSRYALHLQQWSQMFGKQSILVISLDDLQRQPRKVLSSCHRFLKLGPSWLHRRSVFPGTFLLQASERTFDAGRTKRRLTVEERSIIYGKLWTDMRVLELEYGVDVANWGFDVWQAPTVSARKVAVMA